MHVIPQSWSHLHILIGVFPPVGLLLVLGVYLTGFRTGNDFVRRTCLVVFGLLALLSIPIYVSGILSMAALSGNPMSGGLSRSAFFCSPGPSPASSCGALGVLAGRPATRFMWSSASPRSLSS